ncbi:MAG: pyridoxamine 5'-phosphate oxidase family protein [Firmicutes bacterium]|nr:pyridoxamine 5'-phosphate oxidase family protein [Bacillota bacterium]
MKRRELEVTDPRQIRAILDSCKYLNLGLCEDGQPYVLPMNFGYTLEDGSLTLYLHGATDGYKYALMEKNPNVAFSMVCDVVPYSGEKPCQYGNAYSSLMGRGTIRILRDPREKMDALSLFMHSQTGKDFSFNEKLVSIVNVMEIRVTEYSAKRRPLPERIAAGR